MPRRSENAINDVEEYEVDLEENLNINIERERLDSNAGQQMVENSIEDVDIDVGQFFDLIEEQEAKKIAAQNLEVDMHTSATSLRSAVRSIIGVRDFTSISSKNIEALREKNITNTFSLITTRAPDDPLIVASKKSLITNKKLSDDQIKSISKTYTEIYKKHQQRGEDNDHSLAYIDEENALKEAEYFLWQKGIIRNYALVIGDATSNSQEIEYAYESVHNLMKYNSDQRALLDKNETINSLKDFKAILNMVEVSDLSENEAYVWKNRNNPDVEINQNELAGIKIKLQGPEFIQQEQLDKLIAHLADSTEKLQKYDLSYESYSTLRDNVDKQKDILLNAGIPVDTINKLLLCKQIENLQEQISSLQETHPEYNAFKESIEMQKKYILSKGIKEDELPTLLEGGAKELYDKTIDEYSASMRGKALCKEEHWKNINSFYNRLGNAFDAEHNELGTDLSKENLLEAAKVLKEMTHYAKQLSFKGRMEEASHANEQVEKIAKFLIVKGLKPEDIKQINSCYTAELETKCSEIFEKSQQVEKVEEVVEEVTNDKIKKIEVEIEPKVDRTDYSQIEQFDDVPQVREPNEITNDTNSIVNENNSNVIESEDPTLNQ